MNNVPSMPSVTVTGEAEVNTAADQALIVVFLRTFNPELTDTKVENDRLLAKLCEAVESFGIEGEQVRTDWLAVRPELRWSDKEQDDTLIGYKASRTIVITLEEISRLEGLIMTILESGVANIDSVAFNTTESRKFRDQARIMAIRAAKEKAQALANELNQSIGKPLFIQENNNNLQTSQWWWGRSETLPVVNALYTVPQNQDSSENTPAPGRVSVRASVTVTFELTDE